MRIYFLLIFIICSWSLYSQNLISNSGFDNTTSSVFCKNPTGPNNDFDFSPFSVGKLSGWLASHGSPQVNMTSCNSTNGDNDVKNGTISCYMAYNSVNAEGIFTSIVISKDESINLSLHAKGSSQATLNVYVCNGLTNTPNDGKQVNIPNISSKQLIAQINLSGSWTYYRFEEVVINSNYSQLWIFPTGGDVIVDDVETYKSCCEPYKLWQNITNPPSTYVNNYIKAGSNVDTTQSTGKVLITANSAPVKFEAGQRIELLPGFETELGATFVAEIMDCGEKEFEISINEIAPWVPTGSIEPTCFKAFEVSACFGSGKYSYSWDNGFGTNRTSPFFANRSENIELSSSQWLFATVIDEVTNDTIRKGIHIPVSPFTGSFNFDIFNALTPNGDSLNDSWAVIDSTRLGSDSFGYSAYHYELSIFNRWGSRIYHSEGLNKTKGFAFNEINWIEDYCNVTTTGALFGVLNLTNCVHDETISFTITLFCESNEPYNLSVDSMENFNEIIIFPNPSTNVLNINSYAQQLKKIELFDSRGLLVKEINGLSKTLIVFSLDGLYSGNYLLRILTQDNKFISRAIIIK